MPTLILDGHPNPDSLCAELARRYHAGNSDATLVSVRDLHFSPDLHRGLTAEQALEPDLVRLRALIEECDHLVVVSPTWWASVPPMLKGVLDRVLLPGWAYRYRPLPFGLPGGLPQGLLTGRSARVVLTSDTPAWLLRITGDHAARVLRTDVLGFCGFGPVRVRRLGGVRWSTPQRRAGWLDAVERLGRADAGRGSAPRRVPAHA